MLGHAVAEKGFANLEPVAKAMHAADFSEFGGFIFEGKGRIARQKFVFGAHDLRQVRFGYDTVIIDSLGRETSSVGCGQACEISHEEVQGLVCGSNGPAAMVSAPFAGDVQNDSTQFVGRWKGQTKTGGKLAEFDWYLKCCPDENNG